MAAFGLGTLPNLLLAGLAWQALRRFTQARPLRVASGALVLGFGIYGLAHAATLGQHIRDGVLCIG
jgi:sulfite exporter TauE/SafE